MKHLAIPIIVMLGLSSCTIIQSARDKLAQMDTTSYQNLVVQVQKAGQYAGTKLQEVISSDARSAAQGMTDVLIAAIETDSLDVQDIVKTIVDRYSDRLGLEPRHQVYIRDGAKIIDVAVGQIRLGIDGKLSEREKTLILALLKGLKKGL